MMEDLDFSVSRCDLDDEVVPHLVITYEDLRRIRNYLQHSITTRDAHFRFYMARLEVGTSKENIGLKIQESAQECCHVSQGNFTKGTCTFSDNRLALAKYMQEVMDKVDAPEIEGGAWIGPLCIFTSEGTLGVHGHKYQADSDDSSASGVSMGNYQYNIESLMKFYNCRRGGEFILQR